MKKIITQILPYLAAIIIFYIISVGYFTPVIFGNKQLHQTDVRNGIGMGQDLGQHAKENNGERSLWASRMFSGMPAYQIAPGYKSSPALMQLRRAFEGWTPYPASHLFAYMLGFFILLLALRVNPWLAIVGAVAYGFSSYFLIIIEAGHIWKVCVLELIPPTLAGIIWAYRGRRLLGGTLTALFFALQLHANHVQMTYYFLLFTLLFVVCRLIYDIKNKQWLNFVKASVVLLVAGGVGFGANATNMVLSAKYSGQTIRGQSELTADAGNKTGGLDRDYVTQWSYGIGETFTLLIPNAKGGATGYMGQSHAPEVQKTVPGNESRQFVSQQNSYWGDQPMTSGPVYVGAFILFLFVFGLFVLKGYLKWTLLSATILSILLAWGHHFMWLTGLFLDYFPMYNKFRAVSSILVIAELAIPVLALLSLNEILKNPKLLVEKRKAFLISLGLTAGVALVFIILPRVFFHFFSGEELQAYAQYMRNPSYTPLFDALETARVSAFRADAWRSIIIILIGAVLLWLYSAKKIKQPLLVGALAVLVLFDLAGVDKRYLDNSDFVTEAAAKVAWEMTPADRQILEDPDPNYRVLNLAVSPFQDAGTSYYHKSIGGYHGAKLRRYQELIDRYLGKMDTDVLSMLNTRYFIVPDRENSSVPPRVQRNSNAFGHAWFADALHFVSNADEEIAALAEVDLKTTAVIDNRFAGQLEGFVPQHDETATITLVDYKINDLQYKVTAYSEQVAVFPEIYYNDGLTTWEAFIDGKPVPHFRANYVLRALRIPAGEHTVEFVFKPKVVGTLETA
ncbi:MAG: YfhO family protein, partial [Prevotellaceae bacterium]|nr:YfhO family protein [Prevotellaceae bacterium]